MKYLIKTFYTNQKLVPFETMFGFYCAYSGLAGLLNFGIVSNAFNSATGYKTSTIFNIVYLLAGIGMYIGVGLKRINIEAFGLITVITSIIIRTITASWVFGINPVIINSYIFNTAIIFACIIRLITIYKNNIFIKRDPNISLILL